MSACRAHTDNQLVVNKRAPRSSRKRVSISSSNLNKNIKALERSAYSSRKLKVFRRTETEELDKAINIRNVYVRCPKLHLENRCILLEEIPSNAKPSNFEANEVQCHMKATLSENSNSSYVTRRENIPCNDGPSFGSKNCHTNEDDILNDKNVHAERRIHNAFCNNGAMITADKNQIHLSRESGEYFDQNKSSLSPNEHHKASMRTHKIDSLAISSRCLKTQNEDQVPIAADVELDSIPKIISVMTRLVESVESTVRSNVTTTVETIREPTKNTDIEYEDPVKERIFTALTKFFSNLKTKKNEHIQEQTDIQECEADSTACAINDDLESSLLIPSSVAFDINSDTSSSNATQVVLSTKLSGTKPKSPTQMNENTNLLVADETTSLSGPTMCEADLNLMCSEDKPHDDTDTDLVNIDPYNPTKMNDIGISSAAEIKAVTEPTKEIVDLNSSSLNYQSKSENENRVVESCISADASNIEPDQKTTDDERCASNHDTYQQKVDKEEETQILINNNIPDTDNSLSDEESEYSEVHGTVDEIISSLEASDETDTVAFQEASHIGQETIEDDSGLLVLKENNKKEQEPSCNDNTQNSVMTHSRSEATSITYYNLSDSVSNEKFSSPSKVDALLLDSIQSIKQSKARTVLKNTIYTSTELEDTSDESMESVIAAPYKSNECSSASKRGSKSRPDEKEHRKPKINTASRQFSVFSSENNDLSSSSDDEIIDLTKSDDTEPRKNRFELELQIIKELIKEKLADQSQAQVGNVKVSESTPASRKPNRKLLFSNTPKQKKKEKASQFTPVEPENNKPVPIKMIAPKVIPKKRSIDDTFIVNNVASENSSDEDNLISNEPVRKKKLSILDNVPAATEIKATKKDNVKASKGQPSLPKTLSSKVKSVLSAGESDVPSVSKKSKSKKKTVEPASSPERTWKSVNVFDLSNEGSSISSKKEYKPKSLHACTDFVVQPLNIKSQKASMMPEYFSSTALDFKRKSMFNDKIRRESSKDLLRRKIRKQFS